MKDEVPQNSLEETMEDLRRSTQEFEKLCREPYVSYDSRLQDLNGSLESLVSSMSPPLVGRVPTVSREYIDMWEEYSAGRRPILERRVIRHLCWEPRIATTSLFQDLFDSQGHLVARPLEGMIRSCHSLWDEELAKGEVVRRIRSRLDRYTGPSALLAEWKRGAGTVLDPLGPVVLGRQVVTEGGQIGRLAKSWALDEQTPYVRLAAEHGVNSCLEGDDRGLRERGAVIQALLGWRWWEASTLQRLVGKTITVVASSGSEELRAILTQVLRTDDRFGDPRLGRNRKNWVGVPKPAPDIILGWLSHEDIVFFFEHVLPRGADPHRRKQFWLSYVGRLRMSRPFLNQEDEMKLDREVRKRRGDGLGHIDGMTSAFVLDFGSLVAIEFSRVGNACYLYTRERFQKVLPELWTDNALKEQFLKRRSECLARIIHKPGWQDELANHLARHGIRRA